MENIDNKEEQLLESGNYFLRGSADGGVKLDTLELHNHEGKKRIWKVKNISAKEIVFDIVKF